MVSVNWTNITSPVDMLKIPNTNTGDIFWIAMNFLIFIILLFIFMGFGFEVAFLTASFLAFFISIFLSYSGLIAWQWSLLFAGFTLFIMLLRFWRSSSS